MSPLAAGGALVSGMGGVSLQTVLWWLVAIDLVPPAVFAVVLRYYGLALTCMALPLLALVLISLE